MYLYSSDSQQKSDLSKNRDPRFVPGARDRVYEHKTQNPKTERVWSCGRMMGGLEYAAERAHHAVPQLSNS